MDESYLKDILLRALKSQYGVRLCHARPHALRQHLYTLARELDITHLLLLAISPDNPNELWIIQRSELNLDKIKEPR